MPDYIQTVFKHLGLPIPVKKDLPSELISSIDLQDMEIRLRRECPYPLITGLITTIVHIPHMLQKIKFMTTGIKAEFYLLHPKTLRRIARLQTDGWQRSTTDKRGRLWNIEAQVKEAPVEIIEDEGFEDWIRLMLLHEGEEMRVSVEGWCSAGIKVLKTKVKVKRIPVHASLDIPGIPKPGQLDPQCQNDLSVVETGLSHAVLTLHILIRNPTPYTLHIEYLHVHIYHEDVQIGEGYVTDATLPPNSRVHAKTRATFLPHATDQSKKSVESFMSSYVCGKKTILEIRLHKESIPSMPHLSNILGESYAVRVTVPQLSPNQDPDKILETNSSEEKFIPEDGQVGSTSRGIESPIIISATMNIVSSTAQLKLYNPLNVPIHVSKLSSQAMHNNSHIGDLAVSDDFTWTLEPGVQDTPHLPVKWSLMGFGLDPMKGFSMIFDGWQRGGEVSVDVKVKASVKMGNLELGEMETQVSGIVTKIRM